MAPAATLLSPAGTVESLCSSASSMKKWQPKKLVSSRSALIRSSSHPNVYKASLMSSTTSRKPLDSVFGRRRRSGLRHDTRGCSSRPVFAAAVEGSIAIQETSASVEAGESSEETTAASAPVAQEGTAPSTPAPVKAERFKPRVPGQKARREDPSVPAEALVAGAVFTGKVTTIQSFGAFVNFGAFTDGLVHISKLSTGYVSNVSDIVTLGQEVKVTILNVEQASGRIALSMVEKEEIEAREAAAAARTAAPRTGEAKEGGERSRFQQGPDGKPVNRGRIAGGGRSTRRDDPQKPPTKLVKGQEVEGTVKNKIRSGVFVSLANDEEGFLRYSDVPGGDNMAPESSLQSGEKIKATVLKIERGKISLTMKPIVDITSVNRNINKGEVSSATNPFEIAFRAFNLIPKEVDGPALEEAPAVEEVIPEVAAAIEEVPAVEEVKPEVAAAVEEAPAVEEVIPEVAAAVEKAPAVEEVKPEVAAAVEEAPAVEEVKPEVAAAVEEAPAVEEVKPEVAAAVEEAPAVEEVKPEVAAAVEEAPAVEEVIPEVAAAEEEAPAVEEVVPEVAAAEEDARAVEEVVPTVAAALEQAPAVEEVVSDVPAATEEAPAVEEVVPEVAATVEEAPAVEEAIPEVAATVEQAPAVEEVVPQVAAAEEESPAVEEVVPEASAALEEVPAVEEVIPEASAAVQEAPAVEEEVQEVAAAIEAALDVEEVMPEAIAAIDEILSAEESVQETQTAVEEVPPVKEEVVPETIAEIAAVVGEAPAAEEKEVPEVAAEESPAAEDPVPETNAAVNEPPIVAGDVPEVIPKIAGAIEEAIVAVENMISEVSAAIEEAPVGVPVPELTPGVEEAPFATEDVIPKASAAPLVEEDQVEKKPAGVSAALVKQLRDDTGAGMMDCKRALIDTGGDIEKARESLRKKGLASAEKKASRVASEGLVGSYVHDSRIGVLVEVNCETDFVSRGPAFKSLVEDVGMQVVASQQVQFVSVDDIPSEFVNKEKDLEAQREDLRSKPEAIRAKIVEGRVSKRLNELALLEQPYIRDDNILVKDLVKQTVATLGENIKVRRFERYILGEGLRKKGTDFAAEVAAQTAVKEPVAAPKVEETPAPAPSTTNTVVSAALVKELRAQTGAGMMDCKKALTATENDLEKAVEFLRKKGLASADKKSSRLASEGLIGTYIHDGRIGILIEVNCETDFVARGEKFKELVEDLAMQAAAYPLVQVVSMDDVPPEVVAKEKELESGKEDLANKPEAIRTRIVDGRVTKRLAELSLLEQPFIKDDKKLVKDIVKETVASLGENIQVRRFTRFNLGEGLAKRVVDFASEVAAQTSVKA